MSAAAVGREAGRRASHRPTVNAFSYYFATAAQENRASRQYRDIYVGPAFPRERPPSPRLAPASHDARPRFSQRAYFKNGTAKKADAAPHGRWRAGDKIAAVRLPCQVRA